jgi:glycosyltransferase involved in cell wall biosynthesis
MVPSQLNVCMYTPTATGGHARYTHGLLSALSAMGTDKGVQVSLITSRDLSSKYRTSLYPIYDFLPPLIHRSSFQNPLRWGSSRIIHYIKRERAFLRWIEENEAYRDIHFQEYTPWLAPRHFRLLKARGKRLFFTVHNIYPHIYLPGVPKTLFHSWNRAAWRLCDALFVHTEGLQELLSAFLGTAHPPIFVVPHGVWSSPANPAVGDERVQRGHLLFFGQIRSYKGIHVLLRAMEKLTDCTLTVAGAPKELDYQRRIQTQVAQLPSNQVELIERFVEEDEMARLFERSSLLILPYTSFASQSGVLQDALTFGLPVVATDVGALGESVRRWGIGTVVPPNDDAALAGAIRETLAPRRYAEASRAIDRVKDDLSYTRAAELTIKAYRSVRLGSETTVP